MPSQTVLLAGATGMLGARIAHHTGEAALDHLQNDRYPDIRPTTLEEQLAPGVGA